MRTATATAILISKALYSKTIEKASEKDKDSTTSQKSLVRPHKNTLEHASMAAAPKGCASRTGSLAAIASKFNRVQFW